MTADLTAELKRLQELIAARSNGDDPKPGYKANVAFLKERSDAIRACLAASTKIVTLHPEPQQTYEHDNGPFG